MFSCLRSRSSRLSLEAASSLRMTWKSGCVPASTRRCVSVPAGGVTEERFASPDAGSSSVRAKASAVRNLPTPGGPCRIHAWCTRPEASARPSAAMARCWPRMGAPASMGHMRGISTRRGPCGTVFPCGFDGSSGIRTSSPFTRLFGKRRITASTSAE